MFAVNFYTSCFVSRGNSVRKKVIRIDWEKAFYWLLFMPANTLNGFKITICNLIQTSIIWLFVETKMNKIWAKIGKQIIWETKSWKLLGTIEELLEELLAKGKTITIYIHVKNLWLLATPMFKDNNHLLPVKVQQLFVEISVRCNLPNQTHFSLEITRVCQYGINSLCYVGAKIWPLLPETLQNIESLSLFKYKIRNWILNKFPCRLCQCYLKHVFLEIM